MFTAVIKVCASLLSICKVHYSMLIASHLMGGLDGFDAEPFYKWFLKDSLAYAVSEKPVVCNHMVH